MAGFVPLAKDIQHVVIRFDHPGVERLPQPVQFRLMRGVVDQVHQAIGILLHGLIGTVEVGGETWDMEMPAWIASDVDVAAVMIYARREWGHGADPILPEIVSAERAATSDQTIPCTVAELNELFD